MKRIALLILSLVLLNLQASCQSNEKNKEAEAMAQKQLKPVQVPAENGYEHAYFSSGCFWCVEAIYESVKGVKEAISGYSGGHTENPTYEDSNTGRTGHAESVEVIYDPNVVSFKDLVDVYFGSQNITQLNGQGPDHGTQYRSIIFYQNDTQKAIIDAKIEALEKELGKGKVAAQVLPFQKFWKAEAYHQNYEKLHPDHPYIQAVSIPRLNRFKAKFPELLKETLH
ncbi:MAG TPA: peptide-methionine (S)-S-oxide reductase MsrA [Flavobacteriaceae bacterium]|nr:peptide-methionine (S)-S-oxide reductase MsrA [Flavobacteriaceae bacterium]MCB9213587.1 peptide-methionine (S)-S-oxide reductase MsrA [Alteromonas sp.]HPF12088.1 peptide-methionine (S)-S-oxide reductase MsrA [Flavobacteriaceae bacterium]HQU21481.1 peptide-methionine (S)-S-oxide reductase MsrA [Flavobacteriaceae bacterium]HQU65631.1 peptide-methionine (S)-S-oxide reductase MsrA [Flavobacteriaceae bacterium]